RWLLERPSRVPADLVPLQLPPGQPTRQRGLPLRADRDALRLGEPCHRVPNLVIMTAEELKAVSQLDRQAARRAAPEEPLFSTDPTNVPRARWPIPVEAVVAASPPTPAGVLQRALITLEDEDLIRIRAGMIDV